MISLVVEEYCHTCDAFEPKSRNLQFANEEYNETVVTCTNHRICANIHNHIMKEVMKKNANEI